MNTPRIAMPVVLIAAVATLGAPALAAAKETFRARLRGVEEVPAISTTGRGELRGKINQDEDAIEYELSFADLEGGPATAAHIHLGQKSVSGGVIAFLCGGGGKPACPATPGTVVGTIVAADVIGPGGQGIAAGEFDELLHAIRQGVTYANVHTGTYPGGEIRGQIKASRRDDD